MLTLYATPESLYCAKLRILLRHKHVNWREVAPEGGCGSEAYRAMIPAGTLPAIVDGDLVLADSEAISEYLEETRPQPAMLPADPAGRARCRERSRFHDTRLEPELRRLFAHVGTAGAGDEIVTTQSQALNRRLAEMARLLEADESLDTGKLTLGDCGFPVSFAWMDAFVPVMGLELQWPRTVIDYRSGIAAHAAVRQELEAYAAGMRGWLRSKGVTR